MERNASPIQKLSDIDSLGKLGNTVAFALGNTAPSLAAALVGGALGRKMAGNIGGAAGVAGVSVGQETGGIYNEAKDAGLDNAGTRAVVGGAVAGALDAVPDLALFSVAKLFKGSPLLDRLVGEATGTSIGARIADAAKTGSRMALLEGGTEAAQTAVEQAAVDRLSAPGAADERAVAGLMGAVGGGLIGGGVQAVAGPKLASEGPAADSTPLGTPQPPTLPSTSPTAALPVGATIVPAPELDVPLPNVDATLPELTQFHAPLKQGPTHDPSREPALVGPPPPVTSPLPDVPIYYPKERMVTPTILGDKPAPPVPAPIILPDALSTDPLQVALLTRPSERTIDQVAMINLAPNPFKNLPVTDIPDANIIEVRSNNLRSRFAYNEAAVAAEAAERARQYEADRQKEQASAVPEGGEVPTRRSLGGDERLQVEGQTTLEVPWVRSGQEKAAVVAIAQLKQQAGMLLSTDEAFALRSAHEPANVPTVEVVEFAGGAAPRSSLKSAGVPEKVDYLLTQTEAAADAELAPLLASGVLKPATATSVRTAMVRGIQDALKTRDPAQAEPIVKAALEKALKNKLPKQDVPAFVEAAYDRLKEIPRIFYSKAGTVVLPDSITAKIPEIVAAHATNGGSTHDLTTGMNRAGVQGFAVSTYQAREQKVAGNPTPEQLTAYVQANYDALSQPGAVLGTWFNPDDGHSYLNVSTVVDSKEQALLLAAQHNQLAVFDLATFSTIPTADTSISQTLNRRASGEAQRDISQTNRGLEVVEYLSKVLGSPKNLDVKGYYSTPGEGVGRYEAYKLKSVISLAYNASNILSTAAHEGYHYLEDRVLNPKERAVVAAAFSSGSEAYIRLRGYLRQQDIENGTQLEDEVRMVPAEARCGAAESSRRRARSRRRSKRSATCSRSSRISLTARASGRIRTSSARSSEGSTHVMKPPGSGSILRSTRTGTRTPSPTSYLARCRYSTVKVTSRRTSPGRPSVKAPLRTLRAARGGSPVRRTLHVCEELSGGWRWTATSWAPETGTFARGTPLSNGLVVTLGGRPCSPSSSQTTLRVHL